MIKPQTLTWRMIANASEKPGVYAWYYNHSIGKSDVKEFIDEVRNLSSTDKDKAKKYIEIQLEQLVFNKFSESPYDVKVTGRMKPKYVGQIQNYSQISSGLIERLLENPSRFESICEVIGNVAPSFTAPLYIGMAKSLRVRLTQHKRSILNLKDKVGLLDIDKDDDTIAGFAQQVIARGFNPEELFVCVYSIDSKVKEQNDIENILNRINYPIFGRN